MKRPALVPAALLSVLGCAMMTASARVNTDVGVFLRPDTSCPEANFSVYGSCYKVLSRDPVVCGYPLLGYTSLTKSDQKKVAEVGYFVGFGEATVVGEACGKNLYEWREFRKGVNAPCPLPEECS